jgi:hypothetical protein
VITWQLPRLEEVIEDFEYHRATYPQRVEALPDATRARAFASAQERQRHLELLLCIRLWAAGAVSWGTPSVRQGSTLNWRGMVYSVDFNDGELIRGKEAVQ